uniref:Uncharacterized protein n=1 Tax=Chrysemys picta bellii TaxID=8478 RepID=A0A8C3FWN0_CHRPI
MAPGSKLRGGAGTLPGHPLPWELGTSPPSLQETQVLHWLFGCPLESGDVATESFLRPAPTDLLIEIGPRLNFSTAFSTNVVSVCQAAGLGCVDRVETNGGGGWLGIMEVRLGAESRGWGGLGMGSWVWWGGGGVSERTAGVGVGG